MSLFDRAVHLFDGFTYDRDVYGRGPGYDPAILAEGISPITEREQRGMDELSDVDMEILRHKLTGVVEEAHDLYKDLSISECVMSGDMNSGILTALGDPAVVATGIYFHATLNAAPAKYILRHYRDDPTVGLRDGDVFFFNDELAGGTHNYDMFTTMPVFYEGELVAWSVCGGHQGDTGSISPGGFTPNARIPFEEGFRIPVMRIGESDELRTDILDFLCEAVRNPIVFTADLKARLATCIRIRERLLREIERRGVGPVVGSMRKLLQMAEDGARARIRALPDGVFRSVMFMDNLGTEIGLSRIPTTVVKEGDQITLVVNGVSPEAPCGPMNATWHLVRAALGVYLFSYFFRGLPANAGLLEPIRVLSEGPTIANCTKQVARGLGTNVAACVVQNMHVIGSKMLFGSEFRESTSAPFSRNVLVLTFAGQNRRGYEQAGAQTSGNAAGQGAQYDHDGEDAFGFFWGGCVDSGEGEVADSRFPNFSLFRAVECNAHGFGKYRGGAALIDISMAYGPHSCAMTSAGSSDKLSHNPGLFGGYWGPPNNRVVIRNSNIRELLADGGDALNFSNGYELLTQHAVEGDYEFAPSSVATDHFHDGDLFLLNSGGAGGYGDVLERDPEAVVVDVQRKIVTPDVAARVYGVVLDGDSVDVEATDARRAAIRAERLELGKPFDEFVEEWRALRPPSDILAHYGAWPDPRQEGYDKPFWGLYDER